MFTSSVAARDHKRPRSSSKRGFDPLASNTKPGLAVDTSFTRHQGQAPQQVFPYESRTQELSFVSLGDVKALRKGKKGSLRQQLENRLPIRPFTQRTISDNLSSYGRNSTLPMFGRSQTVAAIAGALPASGDSSLRAAPLHKRINGLRPSPLDLTHDISPSDRAITIGIAVPSCAISDHTASPQSALQSRQHAQEVQTPTIVITPAREDFGLTYSAEELRPGGDHRPASSVYSRYTNCAPRHLDYGRTPPVPPLPLFLNRNATRDSTGTMFEEDTVYPGTRENALSNFTVLQDNDGHLQPRSAKRLTSQSHLPTPRRSKGWWNVVTSPFSAGSKSNAFFSRSPVLAENNEDRQRMLDDPSDMGTVDPHAGVIFSNRAPDDEELRSALPPDTGSYRPAIPKRSDTAPGALDAGAAPVNIYRIPSQGLATAYYNPNKHFPSLMLDEGLREGTRGSISGWSPSYSVAHPDRDSRISGSITDTKELFGARAGSGESKEGDLIENENGARSAAERATNGAGVEAVEEGDQGLFADVHEMIPEVSANAGPHNVFTTPSKEEIAGGSPARPTNTRNDTNATLESHFSPLTPTPIVEDAHIATYMGPQSSNGELREVELTPARTRSPPGPAPVGPPAGCRVMAASLDDHSLDGMSEKAPYRPSLHSRTESSDSCGLGIMDGEKELYPPPRAFVNQPRFGTDRFGQLTIRNIENERSYVPWYRRIFWLLVSIGAFLLITLVTLLVIFIPQGHNDMAVEAEWLNLTGFPPLPMGVATVIKPDIVKEVNGCVKPEELWSCDRPSDQLQSSASEPPSFRLEIRFRNGTLPKNETQRAKRSGLTAHAAAMVRRDIWTDSLFAANPAAPSKFDQQFMGQYADNISTPYNGEQSPFYISLLDPSAPTGPGAKLKKRQNDPYPYPSLSSINSTMNATMAAAKDMPRPALRENGKPAEPELYSYVKTQPLRLMNRGQDDEHYGFYTYFDRSLFVSNISSNSSINDGLGDSIASNVGLHDASAVCMWSQTRLHVQIWTRQGSVASLADPIPLEGLPALNATANNMISPGSFPYPVTVTLDRHGGQAKKKGVYCYGLNEDKHVMESVKMWVDEDRSFGGSLVNPATVPSNNGTTLGVRDRGSHGYSGIDGGTGGCACQWRNWR